MRIILALWCLVGVFAPMAQLFGSDHADAPLIGSLGRHDARNTDVFAFVRDENLVLTLCTNPAIPAAVTNYQFAPDLTATFHIDRNSRIRRDNPFDLIQFGGTIVRPNTLADDTTLRVTFDDDCLGTRQSVSQETAHNPGED